MRCQFFLGAQAQFEHYAQIADGRKRRFNRIGGSQRLSVCRWIIIERQQFLATLDQAAHRFGKFVLIGEDEVVKLALRIVSGLCHRDLVQVILCFRLQ